MDEERVCQEGALGFGLGQPTVATAAIRGHAHTASSGCCHGYVVKTEAAELMLVNSYS